MPTLSVEGCAARRQRLIDVMTTRQLASAVITDVRDIYYFSGTLLPADLPAAYLLEASGVATLIGPELSDVGGQYAYASYRWNLRGTRDPGIVAQMAEVLSEALKGMQFNAVGIQRYALSQRIGEVLIASGRRRLVEIDADIVDMQSRKDPDEIEMIRASIRANLAAYEAVRRTIHPGVSELEVLAAGYAGAMESAGEKVFHDGDYQCGQYNGPARRRPVEEGELYIVDAWTCYRGYWSDMSRTFFVGTRPSEVQRDLFDHIQGVQQETPKLLRPGIDGQEVFRELDELIRKHPRLAATGLVHHGGHAIGMRSHEMPDINLGRGGLLAPGQVICIEPGGYLPEARYGVRLENMYLITEHGCEDLCPGDVVLHECH